MKVFGISLIALFFVLGSQAKTFNPKTKEVSLDAAQEMIETVRKTLSQAEQSKNVQNELVKMANNPECLESGSVTDACIKKALKIEAAPEDHVVLDEWHIRPIPSIIKATKRVANKKITQEVFVKRVFEHLFDEINHDEKNLSEDDDIDALLEDYTLVDE